MPGKNRLSAACYVVSLKNTSSKRTDPAVDQHKQKLLGYQRHRNKQPLVVFTVKLQQGNTQHPKAR